jgi:hypothetical protein
MSEKIDKIIEFLGWVKKNDNGEWEWANEETSKLLRNYLGYREFNPFTNWNDCMLMEAKIKADGLWREYVEELWRTVTGYSEFIYHVDFAYVVMDTDCKTRMVAMQRVIEKHCG